MKKLKKCKVCKTEFKPDQPLQMVCSPNCAIEYTKESKRKAHRKERREKLPELYPAKYRGYLQDEINKLARKIDAKLGYTTCIDCDKTLIGIGQVDAAHFHNKKNHGNIRYNLHNLHSAKSDCNKYSDNHKIGYREGIIERYSAEYMNRIDGLDLEYKDIKLKNKEVAEKLAIVRKLNREFDTYQITDGISARDVFNKIIGIYN